ncbi:MAG: hypothetical protein ACXWAY_08280 [Acidimicrobiia bacterium]
MAAAGRFELRSISPDATPEEGAAITGASAASMKSARAASAASDAAAGAPSTWVQAARITARRAGYSRGEWRLSGRLGRRSRA